MRIKLETNFLLFFFLSRANNLTAGGKFSILFLFFDEGSNFYVIYHGQERKVFIITKRPKKTQRE